jgi:hypothetical protein
LTIVRPSIVTGETICPFFLRLSISRKASSRLSATDT